MSHFWYNVGEKNLFIAMRGNVILTRKMTMRGKIQCRVMSINHILRGVVMWGNVTWGTVMQGTTAPPYGFRSNLVCLSKPVKLTDNNEKH
jgi:hypothetical protein